MFKNEYITIFKRLREIVYACPVIAYELQTFN